MPRSRPKVTRSPATPPPRDPPPGGDGRFSPIALVGMGIGIYFATLWFGMTIIGDSAGHSAVMAFVILVLAGVGYVISHPRTRGK